MLKNSALIKRKLRSQKSLKPICISHSSNISNTPFKVSIFLKIKKALSTI
jgi:hypothetical protein